jgi:uncharacterized membrane protein YeaQ/YmgE (transglycosylase-associated protein family)
MTGILVWALIGALVGSFGTAFIHEKTGRDVTMGGIIGLAVGAIGSLLLLVLLWVFLYYSSAGRNADTVYGVPRKRWYRWWD